MSFLLILRETIVCCTLMPYINSERPKSPIPTPAIFRIEIRGFISSIYLIELIPGSLILFLSYEFVFPTLSDVKE